MRLCRTITLVLTALYLIALAFLAVGTFGLFGQDGDPLSAIFLIPLGLPWNLLLDGLPSATLIWVAILAPAFNLALIWLVCAGLGRHR